MMLLTIIDYVPVSGAIFVLLLSVIALIGWGLHEPILTSFLAHFPTMKVNTAIGFALGGISLLGLRVRRLGEFTGWICASAMILLGLLSGMEYLVGDLGLDQLILKDSVSRAGAPPGRMAMATALNFVLIGLALLWLHRHWSPRIAHLLLIPAVCVTVLSFADYIYGSSAASRLVPFTSVSLNSTLAFGGLCVGILCAIPDYGLVGIMRMPGQSGAIARSLIPATVLIPLAVGWLRLWGQRRGWYGTESGIAIFATANIVIMTAIIFRTVTFLFRTENEKGQGTVALRAQRDTLQRQAELINLANDAIIVADAKRVITAWNGGAEKMYGWKESEAVGRVIHELLQTVGPIPVEEIDSVLRTTQRWEGELVHTHKDGRKITVDSRHILPRSGAGDPGSFLEINRDVTERHTLQQQLTQAQKMESLGLLAGGVAHDFNNLLTVIIGYSSMLQGALPESSADQHHKAMAREIWKAGDRAAALTRQLLLFSRKQISEPRKITLNAIVLGLHSMLERLIGADVELVVSVAAEAIVIDADPGQLEQVVMNLVVNARDAMPGGGKLIIETQCVDIDATYAESHWSVSRGRHAVLAVSDSGVGMPEEVRSHIFEPFFTTKGPGKGTGLGLSTVYGIVKQSGGEVFVYSEPGRGTTFKIFFPEAGGSVEEIRQVITPVDLRGAETILLAEDDAALRTFVCDTLAQYGYTVLVSSNGREALNLAHSHDGDIHLLLSDIVMPELGGPELALAFREARPDVPALLMSGYTDRLLPADLFTDLVQKPFTPTGLLTQIRRALTIEKSAAGRSGGAT